MSVKVISFYDKVDFKPNKVGSDKSDIYETVKVGDKLVYKKTNIINRQALMNSEAKNCDIACLYKRLIKGDNSVINTREGVYLNTVNAPKDILEMNNYSKTVEKYFNSNDLLKSVYKNNFDNYFKDYSKGIQNVKQKIDEYSMNIYNSIKKDMSKKKDTKESEVKENENK